MLLQFFCICLETRVLESNFHTKNCALGAEFWPKFERIEGFGAEKEPEIESLLNKKKKKWFEKGDLEGSTYMQYMF